jgi:hypothetical protein
LHNKSAQPTAGKFRDFICNFIGAVGWLEPLTKKQQLQQKGIK